MKGLQKTCEMYEMIVNTLPEGVYLVDRERNILVWNDAAEKITGYSRAEMLNVPCSLGVLDQIDHSGAPVCGAECPVDKTIRDGRERVRELFLKHKRGYRVPVALKTTPVFRRGEVVGSLAAFRDVGVRVRGESLVNSLEQLVTKDRLTGLPNKRQTGTVLESRLEDYRDSERFLAVMYIDLDDVAACNRCYGSDTGNRLLTALADTFRGGSGDSDLVGRWGSEEFVGIFDARSREHANLLAEKIRAMVSTTWIECGGKQVRTTASIGITLARETDTSDCVIDRAALLMRESKTNGKNCVTAGWSCLS